MCQSINCDTDGDTCQHNGCCGKCNNEESVKPATQDYLDYQMLRHVPVKPQETSS